MGPTKLNFQDKILTRNNVSSFKTCLVVFSKVLKMTGYQFGKHADKASNTNKVSLTQNSRAKHLIGFPLITDYPIVFHRI